MEPETSMLNLITCAEQCEYQKEGYCTLTAGAPVAPVRVGGCSYFQPRRAPSPGTSSPAPPQH